MTPKTSTSVGITTLKTAVDTTTPKTSTSIDTTTPKTSTPVDTTTPKTSTSIRTTTPKPSTVTTPKLVSSTKPPGTANIYVTNLPYALFMVSSIIMFIFLFQPVRHDWPWYMLSCLCDGAYKRPLLLIGKCSPRCGGSGFPLSLSERSFTICLTPYNRK